MVRNRKGCLSLARLCLSVSIWCVASSATALDPTRTIDQYVKETWGKKDGLSKGAVFSLAETSDGYLWLGCRMGAIRFDGVNFFAFEPNDFALRQIGAVSDLMEDSTDLLLATWDGVLRFDGYTFTRIDNDAGGELRALCALASGPSDTVWAGTEQRGVWESKGGVFKMHPAFLGGGLPLHIRDLAVDAEGVLWAATDEGVVTLGDAVERLTVDDGLVSNATNTLMFDREGTLWIGTREGLVQFQDGVSFIYTTEQGLSHNDVTALLEDRNGSLWIGTSDGGLHRLRDGTIESANETCRPSSGKIFSLYEDREGALWAATESGVERYRDGAFTTFGRRFGFSEERLLNLAPRKEGGLYVLDAAGALYVFENGQATIVAEEGTAEGDGMLDIAEADDGSLYIGGPNLLRFRNGTIARFPSLGGEISVIVKDGAGLLVAATLGNGESRLYRFDGDAFEPFHADVPLSRVRSIRRDKTGLLWIGTSGKGLAKIGPGGARFFTRKDGLPDDEVFETLEDEVGDVWVSTKGGIARIRQDRVFGLVGVENVPTRSTVHLTADGRGFLFITAEDGIHRVSLKDLRAAAEGQIRRVNADLFDTSDGLFSVDISQRPSAVVTLSDGSIYFAGNAGLSANTPAALTSSSPLPEARIESVTIDGRRFFPKTHSISVKSGFERIEIGYTAPCLSDGETLRFRGRLSGYEDRWKEWKTGRTRTVEYTRLAPGNYGFEVAAGRGELFGDFAKLSIRIEPRWYETWIARGLFVVLFLFLLGLVQRLRARYRRRGGRKVAASAEVNTEALRAYEPTSQAETEEKSDNEPLSVAHQLETLSLSTRSVAHDLNNLLTGICGHVDLARMTMPKESAESKRLAEARSVLVKAQGLTRHLSVLVSGKRPADFPGPFVEKSPKSAPPVSAYAGASGSVLFMDDEAYLRGLAKRSLESFGYRVELAEDGQEAVAACRAAVESGTPFDVIILDLMVPGGMGGMEALREILAFAPEVCAVAAGGDAMSDVLSNPKNYGFKSALPKPYTIVSLRGTVDKAVR